MTPCLLGLPVVKCTCKGDVFVCSQSRAQEWMEGDDFNTEAVMNICGECDFIMFWLYDNMFLTRSKEYLFFPSVHVLPLKSDVNKVVPTM